MELKLNYKIETKSKTVREAAIDLAKSEEHIRVLASKGTLDHGFLEKSYDKGRGLKMIVCNEKYKEFKKQQ